MKLGYLTLIFVLLFAAINSESIEEQRLKAENDMLRGTIKILSTGQNCAGNQDSDRIQELEKQIYQLQTELDTCKRQHVNMASCDDIKDVNPNAASGRYDLDFDGPQGAEPATVACNFEDQTTTFGDSIKGTVDHCSRPGCYDLVPSYENRDQLDVLMEQSDFCQQEIKFDCVKAKISYGGTSLLKWFDVNGNEHDVSGMFNCNSGSSAGQQDIITIRDKNLLPIKQVSYGPLSDRHQQAKITVSPITCSHRKQDYMAVIREKNHKLSYCQMPESCEDLFERGFPSGKYSLDFDGVGGFKPVMAYCKFPENVTIIGEQFDDTISNCPGPSCHTLHTKMNDNLLKQTSLLIAKPSQTCSQNITFHCQSARIHFRGETFLTYRDVSDQSHDVETVPYDCNFNQATEVSDVIEIMDKSHLPITSVSYGPLHHGGQAKVSVGPVSCQPSNAYVLVAGGYPGDSEKVELLDKYGNIKTLPDLPSKMYYDAIGGLLFGTLVICGSRTDSMIAYPSQCYMLSNDGSSWRFLASMSEQRGYTAAVVLSGKLWVSGGFGGYRLQSSEFITIDGKVTQGPDLPEKLNGHASIKIEDLIFVTGGLHKDNEHTSTTRIYSVAGPSFLKEGPRMNKNRAWHGITSFRSNNHDGRVVIMVAGGSISPRSVEIWDHSQPGSTWTEIQDLPMDMAKRPGLHPTEDGVLIIYGDKIYKLWVKNNEYKYELMDYKLKHPRYSFVSMSIPDSVAKKWL